jgi:hypothetical protein
MRRSVAERAMPTFSNMKIHFKDKSENWQYDKLITIGGEKEGGEIVASISITDTRGIGTRVNVLASAGNSCFQDLRCVDGVVYIGFGAYLFVIDTRDQAIAPYLLDGYFGEMYETSDIDDPDPNFSILATSASEVLAFSKTGELLWKQSCLGVDGIVLHRISDGHLIGSGEWDPPGGWLKFVLNLASGAVI